MVTPSPAPSPEPQDVRGALQAIVKTIRQPLAGDGSGFYLEENAAVDYVAARLPALAQSDAQPELDELRLIAEENADTVRLLDYISDKIGLPHDEELSQENFGRWLSQQSDAQPVGWQFRGKLASGEMSEWCNLSLHLYGHERRQHPDWEFRPLYTAPHRPDARVQRMAEHCCIPELDEPFFVLLGRDPQAPGLVEKWALDRQYCEPAEDEKWTSAAKTAVEMRAWKLAHLERGMSMEAFAKIAPHRPGLIEAAKKPEFWRDFQRDGIERAAKVIYDLYTYDGVGQKPEWVNGGNSLKQDEARRTARLIIGAYLNRTLATDTSALRSDGGGA